MITCIRINGFKSFRNFEMYFSPYTVIAGANAAGKSNLFDVLSILGALASGMPAVKALSKGRGELNELFTIFDNGERCKRMSFSIEMLVNPKVTDDWEAESALSYTRMRYDLTLLRIGIDSVVIESEYLSPIAKTGDKWISSYVPAKVRSFWNPALTSSRKRPYLKIEQSNGHTNVSIDDEATQINQSTATFTTTPFISRFNNCSAPHLLAARQEMMSWKFMHLNPVELRSPSFKNEGKNEIDAAGRNLASTLKRLKEEDGYNLVIISRLISRFIPDYVKIDVKEEAEGSRYVIVLTDRKGIENSSRILSEGTLRIIALCILAADGHNSGLICFEEPENGIHPGRLVTMAELMAQLSSDFSETDFRLRQIIVNTHSPIFVNRVQQLGLGRSLIVLARRTSSLIIDGQKRTSLLTTKMTPIVSEGNESNVPLGEDTTPGEIAFSRKELDLYIKQ